MAVRASMQTDLIPRMRDLIIDPTGAGQQFTDQQIQDAYDFRRTEARYVPLRPMPTYQPGGQSIYLDYYSDAGQWESDVVLQDLSYNTLTPTLSEYIVGHWAFAAQPNGIGVRATGKVYDIYAAAADLLNRWAAAVKLDFDYTSETTAQYARRQKFEHLTALAAQYRALAQPTFSRLVAADANPDHDGGGIVYPNVNMSGW